MIIDLTEWNEYIADDVHPGKMPIEVELEVMHIITCDAFMKTPSHCTPPGLTAHPETYKGKVFWKLKTTTRESEKPAMNWISVDDRLPEKAIPCYVLIDEKEVEAYFYPNIKSFVRKADEQHPCGTTFHITHWMPLPEVPK